jgi:hypothetical protein
MHILRCPVALRSRFQDGLVVVWLGYDIACVNQTQLYCVNQMGKTQSKPLAAQHGRGMAWAWHGMCELAFSSKVILTVHFDGLLDFCTV